MSLHTTLVKYGLSDTESLVYLCLLEFGDQTAFAIAKRLRLPRTSVYNNLETLITRKLVTTWEKNGITQYSAESPKQLIAEEESKIEMIQSILPQLLHLSHQTTGDVTTRQYDGADGFRTVYEEILDTMERNQLKRLYAVSNPKMLEYVPRFFPKWLERRMKLGIYTQLIATGRTSADIPKTYANNELRETRLAPESFTFNSTIDIYGDAVAIFSFEADEPLTSIVIESKAVSQMFKQFFDVLWVASRTAELPALDSESRRNV